MAKRKRYEVCKRKKRKISVRFVATILLSLVILKALTSCSGKQAESEGLRALC